MLGSAVIVVAELGVGRRALSIDKGHQLVVRGGGEAPVVVESRPVTDFAAAVDLKGCLHIVAWLLSRHLMYYTSTDGVAFSRSTLLSGDGQLRIKEPMIWADKAVAVAYLAETEAADTLVCYRAAGGDWDGRRLSEVSLPDRLLPLQFEGGPGSLAVLYSIYSRGQTNVSARSVEGGAPETIATSADGISDFCAVTTAGMRHVCWLSNGYLFADGQVLSQEPWQQSNPYLKWDGGTLQCLWMESGRLCGTTLGRQRQRLQSVEIKNPLPCRLALPGELRRAIVDGTTLHELLLTPQEQERGTLSAAMPTPPRASGAAAPTLTEVVRNQAAYMTRLQESVSALERNVLRLTSDVNRLSREVAALLRADRAQRVATAAVQQPEAEAPAQAPAIEPSQELSEQPRPSQEDAPAME